MAIDSIATAIRLLQPAAKAIPVAGTILDGILGTVLELYKVVEGVKTNRKQAKNVLDRVGLLSLTVGRQCQTPHASAPPYLGELKTILEETISCMARLETAKPGKSFLRLVKRAGNVETDNEELRLLDRKVTDAIERFQVAASMERIENDLRKREEDIQHQLHEILKPVHEALPGSYAAPTGCLAGTRVALLDELFEWACSEDSERVLWLRGMAGTGKSAVARTVCDLVNDRLPDVGLHLATFFIHRDAPSRSNALRILHTLLYFIARANTDFRHGLHETLRRNPELSSASLDIQGTRLLERLLSNCADTHEKVVIVVDALDECSDGSDLLRCLLPILRQTQLHIRLLFTSRYDQSIDETFSLAGAGRCVRLDEIEVSTVRQDVEAYFRHHLPNVHRDQVHSLATRANGLFIYAATVVRFVTLNEFFSEEELLDSILNDSKDTDGIDECSLTPVPDYAPLDDLYLRVLRSALPLGGSRQNIQAAAALLRTVILTLVSLNDSVGPRLLARLIGRPVVQVEKVLKRLHAVLAIDDSGAIRLLHISFSEFLLDSARCNDPLLRDDTLGHTQAGVHSTLLLGCLNILNDDLRNDICHVGDPTHSNSRLVDLRARISKYLSKDVEYASRYWVSHMQCVPASPSARKAIATAMRSFCRTTVTDWIEVLSFLQGRHLIMQSLTFAITWWRQSEHHVAPGHDTSIAGRRRVDDIVQLLCGAAALAQCVQLKMQSAPPHDLPHAESAAMVVFAHNRSLAGREVECVPRPSGPMHMLYDPEFLPPFPTFQPELEDMAPDYQCASHVAVSGNGQYVAAACRSLIVIWNSSNSTHPATVTLPSKCLVVEMVFCSTGAFLAVSVGESGGCLFVILTPHEGQWEICHSWWRCACEERNFWLGSDDYDGYWQQDRCDCSSLRLGDISSDGQFIALFERNKPSRFAKIQVKRLETFDRFSTRDNARLFQHFAFPPDPRLLFSAREVYPVVRETAVETILERNGVSMCSVAFSPDARLLVAAHAYGDITAWNIPSSSDTTVSSESQERRGHEIVPPSLGDYLVHPGEEQHRWLEFSEDGRKLLCGNNNDQVLTFAVNYDSAGTEPSFQCLTYPPYEDVYAPEPPVQKVRWVYVYPLEDPLGCQ